MLFNLHDVFLAAERDASFKRYPESILYFLLFSPRYVQTVGERESLLKRTCGRSSSDLVQGKSCVSKHSDG